MSAGVWFNDLPVQKHPLPDAYIATSWFQPKWNKDGTDVSIYVDPSARLVSSYIFMRKTGA